MLTDQQHYYLRQMGIDIWVRRKSTSANGLECLKTAVAGCTKCPLHETRSNTVFARGNPSAKLMIVGEAPGFYEDKQGLPFVGKAGGLLNQMLKGIGLTENEVYIANVLKCRPPNNRDPMASEIDHCGQYLSSQIDWVAPKLLLALGRFAGQYLTKKALPLNQLRKMNHFYNEIPCVVSYHPAYLLRNPGDKKKAFVDLLEIRRLL